MKTLYLENWLYTNAVIYVNCLSYFRSYHSYWRTIKMHFTPQWEIGRAKSGRQRHGQIFSKYDKGKNFENLPGQNRAAANISKICPGKLGRWQIFPKFARGKMWQAKSGSGTVYLPDFPLFHATISQKRLLGQK